ncbi:hypothetical protein [Psychrobacter sp. I-STPA6b]|uniref:hypothetical protein n=1 Tax=Psychrobacter sp. I-STPA6b TaxID=2585718 RepID=UPI001D0CAB27|nr:hypothetical protein [Psychrobacter sp. I-STPA6b]
MTKHKMIHKRKTPNQLAPLTDRQASAGARLPQTLQDKIETLSTYTNEFKEILEDGLPQEILATLWVVNYTDNILTLSVGSHTAANHLQYLSSSLIPLIQSQSITFQQLNSINVIVTHTVTTKHLTDTNSTLLHSDFPHYKTTKNLSNKALSANARKTIAHTASHVTSDEKLKQALIKLANSDT